MVKKTEFKQTKNDHIEKEPFNVCVRCDRKWHNICALYEPKIHSDGFLCATCRKETQIKRPESRFVAKGTLVLLLVA